MQFEATQTTAETKARDVLYCGHWHRSERRYCSSTTAVRLYREGFRCPEHKGRPSLAR